MSVVTAGRFAAATSILALAVATGGTGFAAGKITGHQIKNDAITSKKVKDDSLSGRDVDEGSLTKVPSAASADAAASAGSVGGVTPATIVYRSVSPEPRTVFTGAGLSIEAACTNDRRTLQLIARTSTDASIYSRLTDLEGPTDYPADLEGESFAPGDAYLLTGHANELAVDPGLVTFEYDTPAGRVVTGTLATDTFNTAANACAVTGHLLVS
jgi:hypothetical protein